MSDRFFLDTNIIVYSFDRSQPQKQLIAKNLIQDALQNQAGCISYQVIQEFLNLATRKFAVPLSTTECQLYLSNVLEPICEISSSMALFQRALEVSSRWQFSLYDSLIVAAALSVDSKILYTEDLQHQQKIDDMVILNPFN
jgi:predicted nucleic acid-binding protein